jgi:hypothetical protein
MRLGLIDRIRRLIHPRRSVTAAGDSSQGRHRRDQSYASEPAAPPGLAGPSASGGPPGTVTRPAATPPDGFPLAGASSGHGASTRSAYRVSGPPAVRSGAARARVREAPDDVGAIGVGETPTPMAAAPAPPQNRYDAAIVPELAHVAQVGMPEPRDEALARVAAGLPHQPGESSRPSSPAARAALRMGLPFATPHPRERPRVADGRRNCGSLEDVLWRQWDTAVPPPAEVVAAIDRLAELPEQLKEKLAAGLDAIFVGPGGVPELDEMTGLRGVRLPSGQASWDACAGAYGDRKIVVGSRPSPTPDVMCHEVGHALDDLDSPPGKWQSDSAEFRMIYDQCQPHLASDFHHQPGGLGRKEFFADAFAAIASSQRPALVDMLSGDTRTALRVMLYFNRRYGI